MLNALKQFLRRRGVNRNILDVFHYYVPYLFGGGRAWSPRRLAVELTYRCNLSCEMCPCALDRRTGPVRPDDDRMSPEEWGRVFEDFASMGGKKLKVTGGEPMLVEGVAGLIGKAVGLGLETTLLSNATLITEENAGEIVSSGLHHFIASIDGPAGIHDGIRSAGTYAKTIEGICRLASARNARGASRPRVHAVCTLTTTNQSHLAACIDDLPEGVIDTMNVSRVFYTTEERLRETKRITGDRWIKPEDWLIERELCEYDPDIVRDELARAREAARAKGISLIESPVFRDRCFDSQIRYDPPPFARQCFDPWLGARVDPWGTVYSCSISVGLGSVREKSLRETWNDGPYVEFRKMIRDGRLLPLCSTCCILTRPEWNLLPLRRKR